MTGRDANHGDCAQPCRWDYYLIERTRPDQVFTIEQDQKSTYVFNSRDMCMIEHIPQLIECGISSLKIEGRAKSAYYATASSAARLSAYWSRAKCRMTSHLVKSTTRIWSQSNPHRTRR